MSRTFVHEVGKQDGTIVEYFRKGNGHISSIEEYDANCYSRMKHGDPDAIKTAASELFKKITTTPRFTNLIETHNFAITNSSRSVPTASFTIMQILVNEFLNPFLKMKEQNQIIWVKSSRAGEISQGDYGTLKTKRERDARMSKRQAFFEENELIKLTDKKVILFDDLVATGSYEQNQRKLLTSVGIRPNDILPIFWVQIEKSMQKNPEFEAAINYAAINSLSDLLNFFFDPRLIINARTLKYILSKSSPELIPFFKALGTNLESPSKNTDGQNTLLKIFNAATSADNYAKMSRFKNGFNELNQCLIELGIHPKNQTSKKVAIQKINLENDLHKDFRQMYSRMKYGDPNAVRESAELMVKKILNEPLVANAIFNNETIAITSSAFGDVPTAANAITQDIIKILKGKGINIKSIKIDRAGDFSTTTYGNMSPSERKKRIKSRKISISKQNLSGIKDRLLIIIDDLNATGSHEKTLKDVLKKSEAKSFIFCYLVDFSDELANSDPQTEERLNHSFVTNIDDLLCFYKDIPKSDLILRINARTIKFILTTEADQNHSQADKIIQLRKFLEKVEDSILLRLYYAAISKDGYYKNPNFINGFNILAEQLIARRLVDIKKIQQLNRYTVGYNVTVDSNGNIIDMATGNNINHIGKRYSLMKFGSQKDIEIIGKEIANIFISRLQNDNSELLTFFTNVKKNHEHIMLFSPGSRNVESSQNFILEIAIKQINIWLALNNLPTIILTKLSRLGSNTANYAQLTAEERMTRPSKTTTKLPNKVFFQDPIHIIFGDDVRITGVTADRVEKNCLTNGALSFSSIYYFVVDPAIVTQKPDIENFLNTFEINGSLDDNIIYILNQPKFQPVQRLIRLILSKENRKKLRNFLLNKIDKEPLKKIYSAALGNDYLNDERYAESVMIIKKVMEKKKLINSQGLLV